MSYLCVENSNHLVMEGTLLKASCLVDSKLLGKLGCVPSLHDQLKGLQNSKCRELLRRWPGYP